MKFSIKDFVSKCAQIHSFLRVWLHLLKKPLMKNFIFCAAFQAVPQMWMMIHTRLDIRASGLPIKHQIAFFNVKVFDLNAKRYESKNFDELFDELEEKI